jgi:hypothetical protein
VLHHVIGVGASKYLADTLTHDPLGRVIEGHGLVVRDHSALTIYNAYAGLGALAATETEPGLGTPKLEEFKTDGMGNQYWTRRYHVKLAGGADEPQIRNTSYDPGSGQVIRVVSPDSLLGNDQGGAVKVGARLSDEAEG